MTAPGAPGACTLYDGDAQEHSEFSIQVCNERLLFVKTSSDGRKRYEWKSMEPHDYLDCMSMCWACAAQQGITGASAARRSAGLGKLKPRRKQRIRVV